jgi:flagellar protein FliS
MNDQTNAYLKNRVMTASPEELRLMLIEGAIRYARQAKDAMAKHDGENVYYGLTHCQAILFELLNALDHHQAPELCDRLSSLYTYMIRRSIDASRETDGRAIDELISLLDYERETWVLAMKQLKEERRIAKSASTISESGDLLSDADSDHARASTPGGLRDDRPALSLQG